MPRLVIDVSNLTIHPKKFIKTGIQEVICKTLASVAGLRSEFPSLEILLLPQLPRRFGNRVTGFTTVPYPNAPKFVLESIEEELRLPSAQVWGLDLRAKNYELADTEVMELIAGADRFHIQGMVNISPLACALRTVAGKPGPRLSMTVYDLIPVLFPEYCPDGIPRWYTGEYLPAVGKHIEHAYCISRNTALDLRENPLTSLIPRISVLPLPFELGGAPEGAAASGLLGRHGLEKNGYLLYLGSLEPRKNFDALLAGFETFKRQSPRSSLKLALVGSTGWKNALIEKRLKNSPFSGHILQTGYLSDADLAEILRSSASLALLSQYEGYGLPVAQAYSKGIPVITTLGSSLPEACGGDGIFVEPADPYSVAAGIRLALQSPGARTAPGAISEWTWRNYARALIGEWTR